MALPSLLISKASLTPPPFPLAPLPRAPSRGGKNSSRPGSATGKPIKDNNVVVEEEEVMEIIEPKIKTQEKVNERAALAMAMLRKNRVVPLPQAHSNCKVSFFFFASDTSYIPHNCRHSAPHDSLPSPLLPSVFTVYCYARE